ncbi:hypothetical protein JZ751_011734 [Albula glossodonta]|uniref:Protein transport protein Sec31A-like n=1 Tax=Albula glossodonta TaxID=121402 RepID=A0A8T2PQI3_9TELE|nr:hypothetical protein JZ751_011734 [Albula glossodonta]
MAGWDFESQLYHDWLGQRVCIGEAIIGSAALEKLSQVCLSLSQHRWENPSHRKQTGHPLWRFVVTVQVHPLSSPGGACAPRVHDTPGHAPCPSLQCLRIHVPPAVSTEGGAQGCHSKSPTPDTLMVQHYTPGIGGPAIYQPQQYSAAAAPPPSHLPPSSSSSPATAYPPYMHPPASHPLPSVYPGPPQGSAAPLHHPPLPPTSSFSPPPLSSGASSFQHSGPGAPAPYLPPPPTGPTGTQPDPNLVPASQRTGLHQLRLLSPVRPYHNALRAHRQLGASPLEINSSAAVDPDFSVSQSGSRLVLGEAVELGNKLVLPVGGRPQNGWNDPPTLSRVPKKKKVPENYTPPAPITAPIMTPLGDPPAQAPVQHAQGPPALQPQQLPVGQPGVQAPYQGLQQPMAPPPRHPTMPSMNVEGAPGAPTGDVIQPVQAMPAEKVTKKPIPEEHLILKTTFEGLIQKCLAAATDPAAMASELSVTRLSQLSPAIVGGLHNMAQTIEARSYMDSLSIHTHIVSSSNFSETSAFMPVLKVVLTQANKLGV